MTWTTNLSSILGRDGGDTDRSVRDRLASLFHPTTFAPYFHPASYAAVDLFSPAILDRSQLERRLRENGSIEYYDQEREVEIGPPEADKPIDEIADRVGRFTIEEPFVGALEDVHLVGSNPIPIDESGRIVLESVVSPEVLALNAAHSALDCFDAARSRLTAPATPPSAEAELDNAVLLYNCWNDGYFHWTTETLPRLEGVERYRERTGVDPKLVVGPNPTRFQLESLELLGYDREDLIPWDCYRASVDRLIVPSVRRELNPGETSPVAHEWLQKRMREAATDAAPEANDDVSNLVYVSREDADYRQVLNEDEVLDVLEPYGFEKYVLSERSVAADVNLFAQADVVVSPHGAGLTNVIYSDDASVVELFRSNYVQPVYFVLSKQLDNRYRYLLCDYERTDIEVDVDELEAVVTEELAQID